ncbi:bifunctional enoyl-CoA hydratase/phosphate acetyltransferase [Gallaecimonas pentaromativorans]|uniref:bifunctional enoyl-CoA hydratase/phosphate acetyltransferase n=1 Tax=Gallaecimonas pentaromativorans TaxID=584787 RepID=UPI003A8DF8D5
MDDNLLSNITFDELYIGQSASLKRKLTQDDINLFALMSGDVNPAHMNPEYAKASLFHGVIGHGMWSGALISTVLGTQLPGPGTIYLSQDIHFKKPVRLGDEITVTLSVKSKGEGKPLVDFDCQCINEHGEVVVSGIATVLAPTEHLSLPRPMLPSVAFYQDHYQSVISACQDKGAVKTAVVHPVNLAALQAVKEASDAALIEPVLVGPKDKIRQAATEGDIDISPWPLIDTEHSHEAAAKAAELAACGQVQAIMKGALHTDELLGAVVKAASGLRTERRISHCYVMDVRGHYKPLIITDAAINIAPSLEEKADICQNAINLWQVLFGHQGAQPKVAILSAVETVTSRISSTLDAASLCKMADRGQITGGILDGPLALDNAISREAAANKGIHSPVAGDADILVVPNIEAGNMLAKQLTFLGKADAAGIVLGARVPIILTSRADSLRTRLLSCAAAVFLAAARREGNIK